MKGTNSNKQKAYKFESIKIKNPFASKNTLNKEEKNIAQLGENICKSTQY